MPVRLSDRQRHFSGMLGLLLVWLNQNHYTVRCGDAWRSTDKLSVPGTDKRFSYQDLLVYNKRSKMRNSPHNNRLAIDIIIERDGKDLTPGEWRQIGRIWESIGGRWGGRFGVNRRDYNRKIGWDRAHFELAR